MKFECLYLSIKFLHFSVFLLSRETSKEALNKGRWENYEIITPSLIKIEHVVI